MNQVVIATLCLGVGIALLLVGLLLGWGSQIPSSLWMGLMASLGIVGAGVRLRSWAEMHLAERRLRRARREETELAARLTPLLFGDFSHYIIEAAEQLGAAREITAVPALCRALEECVDAQRPGWREVAEALANALARIGDRRALPLLMRLENVRGIGFIPAVRQAIAAIEPQTSLLRPGSAQEVVPGLLLRPATPTTSEHKAHLLLRSASEE